MNLIMFYCTIVRHGETKSNVNEIIHTRDGGELTERGILMAKALGRRIKDETFTRIFTSPFTRARDTTTYIVSQLTTPVPPITIEPLLRERDIGEQWESKNNSLIDDKLMTDRLPPYRVHTIEVAGAETYDECKLRCQLFFNQICKLVDEIEMNDEVIRENVLIVSHGWFIACLFDYIIENTESFVMVNFDPDDFKVKAINTCRTTFKIERRKEDQKKLLTFSHFYDTTHLSTIPNL